MFHELKFENCAHSQDPLVSCALEGVANVIAGIRDVAVVIHSPQGCSATVAAAYDNHEIDFTRRKVACSRLFESDIIMGATQKLKELILQADQSFQAKVMFVVGTCAADIIGEDLEAVCRAMQGQVKARLISVMAGGFRGNAYDGMNLGLSILAKLIQPVPILPEETPVTQAKVNLILPQANLNPTWWADMEWVRSILAQIGVATHTVLARNLTLEDLARAAEAPYSILLNHDAGHAFAQKLSSLGSQAILAELPLPIGVENTGRWLRALGCQFHAEEKVEEIIQKGESRVQDILRKRGLMIIPRYRNCRIAISADCTIGIPLVRALFNELEMIPELLLFRSESPEARRLLDAELQALQITPQVVFNADGWKTKSALLESGVDAVLGSSWEKYLAEELGIKLAFDVLNPTNRDLYVDRPYFGYEGYLYLLEAIGNEWEAAFRSKEIVWEQFQ
ncbi:MAG TPA: nitrogenase component 1 [Fibrobacteraceae bacterium]|nr:nitrogenase component 1 [Fibrobacteraceae bacterium]